MAESKQARQPARPGTTVAAKASLQQEAERQADQADSIAYKRVRAARDWFAVVVPSHIDPEQYIAVLLGVLQRNDKLREAAEANPGSLMIAAAECARLGLVPGETYHFAPFWNSRRQVMEITGMTDYKGEIELMYRAGGVESVHAQVVREHDAFAWKPGMTMPEHQITANESGQIGLSDEDERGRLTGVYAFAKLRGGGVSQVVVMSRSEVKKHRDIAKTEEFWGPPWPKEGPWTPNMWLKTALHGLPTWVPTSPEYITELWRAAAAVTRVPDAVLPPSERRRLDPPAIDGGTSTLRGRVESARGALQSAARSRPQSGDKDGEQPPPPEKEDPS